MIPAKIKALINAHIDRSTKLRLLSLLYAPFVVRDQIFFSTRGVKSHSSWRLYGLPVMQLRSRGSFFAGVNLVLCSKSQHNSIGVGQPCVIKTLTHDARITVGANVGISGATLSARSSILIGNNVLVGSGVLITDNDSHPLDPRERSNYDRVERRPVVIEDDVFLGARSIILKGVTVARGTVLGAGAVLTRSTNPYSIYAGNPARFIKYIDQ